MLRQTQIASRSKLSILLVFLTALIFLAVPALLPIVPLGLRVSAGDNTTSKTDRQSSTQACPTCEPPSQQVIYAPLIELPEASRAEIVLNCRSPYSMEVTPTFYTEEGIPIVGQVIHLQPTEMRFVDVLSLIPSEHRLLHKWGGMSLSYNGQFMEARAQLTLHDIGNKGSTDVLFAVIDAPRSNVREAVWQVPGNGTKTVIAMGNYSDASTTATLTFANGETQQINLAPYATRIVRRQTNGNNNLDVKGDSVTIRSSGQEGRLITTGLVTSASQKLVSSLRFYDTQNITQPNLYAANFRLKDSIVHLLLKNTTASEITAKPRFVPKNGEGTGVIELPSLTLQAGQIVELDLTTLTDVAKTRPDLDSVSVQIINSGNPGSLIGALYSRNNISDVAYDVPLRDSGLARNSAGAYPLRLSGDYTTVLTITNVSNKTSRFTMLLVYEGGRYAISPREIAAGATATFDIRKLRDEQTPDSTGGKLPRNLTVGQIRWSLKGDSSTRLIGRSEVVSKSGKVSNSYSCGVCCPNSYYLYNGIPGNASTLR